MERRCVTQRETRDLPEVRVVLDEAVVLLHRISYDMDEAKAKMNPGVHASDDGEKAAPVVADARSRRGRPTGATARSP